MNITLASPPSATRRLSFCAAATGPGAAAAFAFTGRKQPWVEERVAVATYAGMAYNPVGPQEQNIVLVLDAAEATAKDPRCVSRTTWARRSGMCWTNDRSRLGTSEILSTRSSALNCFRRPSRHGHRVRPVHTELGERPERRRLRHKPETTLQLKRHAFGSTRTRERCTARLARAFAAGDQDQLARLLPDLPTSREPCSPRRVVVMVENLEHALQLMPSSSGWSTRLAAWRTPLAWPSSSRANQFEDLPGLSTPPCACL